MNNYFKMCTLHDVLSSKIRFIYTSTVTGSDSYSRKKNDAYAILYIRKCDPGKVHLD